MELKRLLELENDGLNMAVSGDFLFVRCMRSMIKYRLSGMGLEVRNVIFKKDGKARGFSVCDRYVFLTDFCELYILDKGDLSIIEVARLGTDNSSDLGAVRFGGERAYISIRNGMMAVMDINARTAETFRVGETSSWDHCVAGKRLFSGTVGGELVETDAESMRPARKVRLCGKNICSVVHYDGTLYAVSQDMALRAVDAETLEVTGIARKAVRGMAKILGIHGGLLVIADRGVSIWDRQTLRLRERLDLPTGHFNKGALLHGKSLIGSDYRYIYGCDIEG